MNNPENNRNAGHRLAGRVVFITGAASGIGKATANALLEQGAKVFDFSLRDKLADEHPDNGNVLSFNGDVGNEADVQAAFSQCVEQFGTVDVLINNAGLGIPTPDLAETDLATYERMINTNMRGVFLCNREALRLMKPQQSGHIVTLISMAGQRTNPGAPIYCRVEVRGAGPEQRPGRSGVEIRHQSDGGQSRPGRQQLLGRPAGSPGKISEGGGRGQRHRFRTQSARLHGDSGNQF